MKCAPWVHYTLTCAIALATTAAFAADYYVARTGSDDNDGLSAEAPFATIDKAVITARTSGDIIHVQPGEYETTLGIYSNDNSKWGPNLCVKMVGEGATRDDVVLKSHGSHRTLRMAAGSWVENMTLEGEPTYKADNGGVLEISGGTLTNCVVRNGTATGNGGNIFINGSCLVIDCVISNGITSVSGWDKGGGNIFINGSAAATISRCDVSGGQATNATGGGIRCRSENGIIEDCLFRSNSGGGICLEKGGAYNCTVVNNTGYGLSGYSGGYKEILNCAVFGNTSVWNGTRPEGTVSNMAVDDATGFGDEAITITASAFADYGNEDFRPATGSELIDAGVSDTRGTDASSADLDGNPRISGTIDIGCYEYQKLEMTVRIASASYDRKFAPATLTFSHVAENASDQETVTFTYDFGDNSAVGSTSEPTISHNYAAPGIYTVTITASSDCEDDVDATLVYAGYVKVASSMVFVNSASDGAAFPYDTPATAFTSVSAALAHVTETSAPEIKVVAGTYEQTAALEVSTSVKISGLGSAPDDVVLRNTASGKRVMVIGEGTSSWIENLTMEGGQAAASGGGNLLAKSGTITNCIIRGGSTTSCPGGGVRLDGGAPMLTHCVITNNAVVGTPGDSAMRGGAVYLHYGSAAKVSNCLIAFNTYSPSTEKVRGSAGLVLYGSNGSAVIQNCSVVSNMVIGTISDNMAAAWSGSWDTVVRNCVFAGNYVTGAGKCSGITFPSQMKVSNCVIDDSSDSRCATATVAKMFRDFGKGDFRPLPGGALFDKGVTPTISTSVDLAGNPRIFGKTIDVGCYECQTKPHTILLVK